VIIVKENHGFDNYFGTFPGANGAKLPRSPNPPHQDPNHRHDAWLTRKTTAVGEQFVEHDIPAYFAYARQFTLCDNYFTDVAGPSTPNHIMLITADSPIIVNPPRYRLPVGEPLFDLPSLPAALEKAGNLPPRSSSRMRPRGSCLTFPGSTRRTTRASIRRIRTMRATLWSAMSRTACSGRSTR